MGIGSFYKELKRRNILKSSLAYLLFSWILIQVASILFPTFNLSQFWLQFLIIGLSFGFGVWILLSWHYEMGPHGIKRTISINPEYPSQRRSNALNYLALWIVAILLVVLSITIYYTVRVPQNISPTDIAASKLNLSSKSIAVLAFTDMSPLKDQEYFSDGISEEILNYLARNPELTVISRTSSFSFKGKDADVRKIGEQLNANYILEGSVRKSDSNLRVTAQLVRADNGVHIWAESYQRQLDDIFDIQDDIAKKVASKLQVSLLGNKVHANDPDAYNKFLQAKSLSQRFNLESATRGLSLIDQSLEIDSVYAPAWLLKSKLLFQKRVYTGDDSYLDAIEQSAQRAITIYPDYAEGHAWSGRFNSVISNFDLAYRHFKRAITLDDENSEVLRQVSYYPSISLDDRIRLLKKAKKVNPLDPGNERSMSIYLFFQENFQGALEALDNYLVYQPFGHGDHGLRAELLAWLGRKNEALLELNKEEDEFSKTYSEIMMSLVLNLPDVQGLVEKNKELYENDQPYLLAQMYAYMNNKEEAYKLLEQAIGSNNYDMLFQLENDPYMRNLKKDKRYKQLLKSIQMPKTLEIS